MVVDIAEMQGKALYEARFAGEWGEVPIGAVVWNRKTGEILGLSGNRTIEMNDPTAHAEVLAIRQACRKLRSQRIPECDMYVTLEPCTMCVGAIAFARIGNLYYGAKDDKGGAVSSGVKFFDAPTCHHKIKIHGPMDETGELSQMLKDFFKKRR